MSLDLDQNIRRVAEFIGRTSLTKILLSWIFFVLVFGFLYFGAIFFDSNAVLYNERPVEHSLVGLSDLIYFSIITATTTGYGDLVPTGWTRLLAVIEVVVGFLILSVIISKLVSGKQDLLLEELYNLSCDEKVKSIRSALRFVRIDCEMLAEKWSLGRFTDEDKRRLSVLTTGMSSFLGEAERLLSKKDIDHLLLELVLYSIEASVAQFVKALNVVEKKHLRVKSLYSDKLGLIVHHLDRIKKHYAGLNLSEQAADRLSAVDEHVRFLKEII